MADYMKKWLKRGLVTGLILFVAMQLVPVNRTQPAVDAAKKLPAPPEVEAILRASCYDCHSNETQWPWYAQVAPVSWWIANHVNDGRRRLNLSEWANLHPKAGRDVEMGSGRILTQAQFQVKILGDMETAIMEGQMPLPSYLIIHTGARISPAQFKILSDWFHQTAAQITAAAAAAKAK